MTHLSNPTAAALKAANFPQPAPAPGQFWYNLNGDLCCVIYSKQDWSFKIRYINSPNRGGWLEEGKFIYCPTAEDILRELGDEWTLGTDYEGWVCMDQTAYMPIYRYIHESAAEACAMAWLDKNKNKI